jgi:hypothetical protein
MRGGAAEKNLGPGACNCARNTFPPHIGDSPLIRPFPDSCRYQLGVRKLKTSHPRTLDASINADIRPHPHLGTWLDRNRNQYPIHDTPCYF